MSKGNNISEIVYFGDSFTDGGTLFDITTRLLTQPFPLASFGYSTRITNGQNYADVVPDLLDADTQNFAIGGARAIGTRTLVSAVDPGVAGAFLVDNPDPADLNLDINLGGQVARYLATLGPEGAAPGTAASLFIGLNDFNNFRPTDPANIVAEGTALAASIAAATLGAAAALAQAGVDTIIINTLPLPSFFPTFKFADPLIQATGDLVISGYNDALVAQAAQLEALGVTVKVIDLEAISGEVAADPSAFGFQTVAEQLYFGTAADPIIIDTPEGLVPFFPSNPAVEGIPLDQLAFIDLFHPTEALHETLGVFSAESLESEVLILGDDRDVSINDRGDQLVLAGAGNDFVATGKGDDVILAGAGNDVVAAGKGSDLVSGGAGRDLVFGGNDSDFVAGADGDDTLFGGSGRDALTDGDGSDRMFGGTGSDVFFYTESALTGGVTGADQDVFFGGSGRDTLVLTLSDDMRDSLADDLAHFRGGFLNLSELGLKISGIERIVIRDASDDAADLVRGSALEDRVMEAELWGFA